VEKDGSCVHVCVHERKEEGKVSDHVCMCVDIER